MGWYGGCDCEDVMVSQFDTDTTRGRLTFISTDFAGASYYFARVRSSFDRLICGKFYIISNETGGHIDIPNFNIVSTDGGESLTECCDVADPVPPTIISPWHVGSESVDISVPENTIQITTIVASGDSPILYSLANFSDHEKLNLNSTTGELSFKSPPDYESPTDVGEDNTYSVKVVATNGVGTDELILNIRVVDVDDTEEIPVAPTIILPSSAPSHQLSVLENTLNVSTIVATGDAPISYSIQTFGDHTKFQINQTSGLLSFISAPDYENPNDVSAPANDNTYKIRVVATNETGTDTIELDISVTDKLEIPLPVCSLTGNIEDSCIEVTSNSNYDSTLAGIYTYNDNGSSHPTADNSKPSWTKSDDINVELFYTSDNVGYWTFKHTNGELAQGRAWGYETDHTSAQIPPYPWCTLASDTLFGGNLWQMVTVSQIDCPDPVVIPCCDGFTYTHTKSTEDDPSQTGEQYGDVELQKSKNPFPSIESQYPQWNISTLCHNGAFGGVPSRSPIEIVTLQNYLGLSSYPYKHGEIALGAEHTGEMRITLANGDCYHACVSPSVSEIIFIPSSEPLDCS